jgi:hypothetical protein
MILGIPLGESYSSIHALADLSVCVLIIPTGLRGVAKVEPFSMAPLLQSREGKHPVP